MLKGKTALVTGSTGGLGLAVATGLAAAGCNIVINGMGDGDQIEAHRCRLEQAHGVRAIYDGADLARPDQIARMMAAAIGAFGAVDILVNNAVVRHFAAIEKFPVEAWDQAIAVNLSAAFHTIRLAMPHMRERNFGRIINMSSVFGLFATAGRVDYVTTKTALIGMTRAVAQETVGQNITCNALCPGSVLTPYSDGRIKDLMAREEISREAAESAFLAEKQPSRRFISADSIAAMVVFLCGPAGRDITGAAIPMDGGWSTS